MASKRSTKQPSTKSSKAEKPGLLVGTSGWSYAHWRRIFYPESMPVNLWLSYYARYFDTVEINNSFYNLPLASTFEGWRERVPEGFVFAVKANRIITHLKKLKDTGEILETFLGRSLGLKANLGPILFQLPPSLKFDPERLRDFVQGLPSRRKFAVEFRNSSWLNDKTFDILNQRKIAFCIHDLLDVVCPNIVTSSFAYFRFHGFGEKYGGSYPRKVLKQYAEVMAETVGNGTSIYAYFNNDAFGYAIRNAITLRSIVLGLLRAGPVTSRRTGSKNAVQ